MPRPTQVNHVQRNDSRKRFSTIRRKIATATVVILVAGCTSMAARTPEDYDRGAASMQKFDKDFDACVKQAEAHQKEHGYGPYDLTHGSYNYMFDLCMRSSGYQRKAP